mgnify:FL=1
MIEIDFDCERKYHKSTIKLFIENSIDRIVDMLDLRQDFYLSVLITSNKKIKEINFNFRNINKPTNVLSFPQNEIRMIKNSENHLILGDIVLSIEKILYESIELERNFWEHLLHIVTHGVLHLFGYDHQNEKDAKRMELKENFILKKLKENNICRKL